MEQPTTSVDDLSDDLLELFLLGHDSPICLTRAAATCKRWRRVVADADGAFLRRFRSLHAQQPVGHSYYAVDADPPCSFGLNHTFPIEDPVFVPSPGSAAATGDPGRRQISLDFLPSAGAGGRRQVVDSRGSLLLVLYDKVYLRECTGWAWYYSGQLPTVPELVVCEPLTRRYQEIALPWECGCVMSAFLVDGDAGGGAIGMANFRVLLVLYDPDREGVYTDSELRRRRVPLRMALYTAMFSCGSNDGIECTVVGDYDWDGVCLPNLVELHFAGRTGGRIYWGCEDGQVLILDERTLEFSTMALPDRMMRWNFHTNNFRIIGAEDGSGAVRVVCITGSGDLEVYTKGVAIIGSDVEDWVVEKSVELAKASLHLPGRKEEYFGLPPRIIAATELVVLSPADETWLFSVDLHTLELERDHERNRYKGMEYPCALPWPPVMRACLGN